MKRILLVVAPLLCAGAFCGCQQNKQEAPKAVAAESKAPAVVSAEKNSFQEVTARLDPGGSFYLYASAESCLSGLTAKVAAFSNLMASLPGQADRDRANAGHVADFVGHMVEDSGVAHISGLGISSIAIEQGVYWKKVILHHYKGQNSGLIWSACGTAAHSLDGLALLPRNTVLAGFGDFDGRLVWTTVMKDLRQLPIPELQTNLDALPAQFEAKAGIKLDDLLGSLGGEYGIILTLDEQSKISIPIPNNPLQIPEPGLAIVIKVTNEVVFNRVSEILKSNPMVVSNDEANLKMRVMPLPLPIPISLRVTVAQSGNYLIIASTDKLVREMLAARDDAAKGYKSGAEFQRLAAGMPTEGNAFWVASARFNETIMKAQSEFMAKQNQAMSDSLKAWQESWSLGGAAFAVASNGEEGWELVAKVVTPKAAGQGNLTKN